MQLTFRSLNPSAWNLRGKGGFIWCGFALISWVWSYYRLPETRGRSAGQLDLLFSQKVPARKFSSTEADPFHSMKHEHGDAKQLDDEKADVVVEHKN